MINNLKDIGELMKEQEGREQHKHSLIERLESITMQVISKGIKERSLRKALNETDSLREKLVIILRKISKLDDDLDDAKIESEIAKVHAGADNNIEQLFELCERKLKQLEIGKTENREKNTLLCLSCQYSIFDLTKRAHKYLRRRFFRKSEEIDEERFDVIYLPLYKVGLQLNKLAALKPVQVFVHAVNGGIIVVRRSEIEFKRAFSTNPKYIRAMDGKETELKWLPEDKGNDIVVIREGISLEKIRHFVSTAFNVDQISEDDFTLVHLPIFRFYLKSKKKDDSGEITVRAVYLDGVFGKVINQKYIPV